MKVNYGEHDKVAIHFNQEVLTVEEAAEIIDHGEHIGYYRVNHLVGPPKSEEFLRLTDRHRNKIRGY